MTIYWKAVEQYFSVVLFVFQFPVCMFAKFIDIGLGTINNQRVKIKLFLTVYSRRSEDSVWVSNVGATRAFQGTQPCFQGLSSLSAGKRTDPGNEVELHQHGSQEG